MLLRRLPHIVLYIVAQVAAFFSLYPVSDIFEVGNPEPIAGKGCWLFLPLEDNLSQRRFSLTESLFGKFKP